MFTVLISESHAFSFWDSIASPYEGALDLGQGISGGIGAFALVQVLVQMQNIITNTHTSIGIGATLVDWCCLLKLHLGPAEMKRGTGL